MAAKLKGRAARPREKRNESSGERNDSSGGEQAHTERPLRERRVEEVLRMMSRGQWLSGVSDGLLAEKWKCDASTVRHVAAEASRALRMRLREDPEAQREARAALLQNIDVIRAKAMGIGDAQGLRVALEALRTYGFYLGIEPAKKLDVTERHDPFEGWSQDELEAFAAGGPRGRRALRASLQLPMPTASELTDDNAVVVLDGDDRGDGVLQ